MPKRLLLASMLIASPLVAQTPAPQELLDQLVANAAQYRATIPSLTADEFIQSEASYRGMFKDKVETRGTFRAIRGAPGEPLKESREIVTVNGKPIDPDKKVRLPFALFGGFGRFQEMFFTTNNIRCFAFTLLPDPGPGASLQLRISVPTELDDKPGCSSDLHGITGLARIDAATHQILHLERTVPEGTAAQKHLAPFASVDCAPTKVGDDTFWLPTTVIGGTPTHAIRGQFLAHYSNYHRYAASITVLPGATEVAPSPPASTPP